MMKERKTYARCQACVKGALASKSHRAQVMHCMLQQMTGGPSFRCPTPFYSCALRRHPPCPDWPLQLPDDGGEEEEEEGSEGGSEEESEGELRTGRAGGQLPPELEKVKAMLLRLLDALEVWLC
jgi:hypothetical protein